MEGKEQKQNMMEAESAEYKIYSDEIKSEQNSQDRLSEVLNILNLTDKYPGRLTCSDMYNITKGSLSDEQPKCHKDLANYFLHKIAKYNYTARDMHLTEDREHRSTSVQKGKRRYRQDKKKSAEETKVVEISPMDVIIAVFLCCDDICRQDLVSHMWSCRMAVPLIIQEKVLPSQPSCYLWPLRSIVMRWETEVNEEHCVREGRLVKEPITSFTFIRFGEFSVSKSALINKVISGSEKTHSIFMNRDSPGSIKDRRLVDGMIDIGWYFPTPKRAVKLPDCFQDAVMFLNLHGDAYGHQSQLELLSKLANTITVLCKVTDFHRCRNILKSYIDGGSTFLLILTDQTINTENEDVINDVLEYLDADETQLEFVEEHKMNNAELLKQIRLKLSQLSKKTCIRLEDILSLNVRVSIDEKTKDHKDSKAEALIVSNRVRETPYYDRIKKHLPLQGDPWNEWAKADKDRLRNINKSSNKDVESHKADRLRIMNISRLQQRDILKRGDNDTLLQRFIKSINTDNDRKRKLFLRWLKYELEDLSREELRPVYKRYQQIIKNLATVEEQVKGAQKVELEKLNEKVTMLYFGLEHILREMGQTYEALMFQKTSIIPGFNYNLLPDLASKILLDGYPFELLDGHVNSVPLCWVKDVLNALEDAFKRNNNVQEVRTKVISALGIQSSGKSTMLNVLFGCQYAVSAGRCTRGVYCQVIEVHQDCREELGIDLILSIDTEGLRAPELSAADQMVKHDNELSTFVIGLADITILNLMGENTTSLDELLPISVHAFLRMEMATQFKPKCVIIHQNVSKENEENLLNQVGLLEKALNKMTQLACNVEGVETKSFNDIIDFDVSRDVYYVSPLLEGIQPMAPISTRYSEELNTFKQALLKKDDDSVQKSLTSFVSHLETLWSNIKKDDFVYQFRNTIETEARRKLDDFWCHVNCSFRQPINKMVETSYIQLQNCTDIDTLNSLVMSLESDLIRDINKEYDNQKCTFKEFLDKADTVMKETMMRWSTDMEKRFDDLRTDLVKESSTKLREFEEDTKRKISINNGVLTYEIKLKAEIQHLVSVVKSKQHTSVSELDISSFFETHWKDWTSYILRELPRHKACIDIEKDAHNAIKRSYPSGLEYLTRYLSTRTIDTYDTSDFDVNEIVKHKFSVPNFIGHSKDIKYYKDLAKDVFELVDANLNTRKRFVRPYAAVDIDEIVRLVQQHLESKRKTNIKHNVYFLVLVCGHAIKRLRKFHEEYESQNNLGNVLDSQKKHYFSVFKSLFSETERLNELANNCQEILKKGILKKMTRSFIGKIVIGMENSSLIRREKSWIMLTLLIDTASVGSFDDFITFIETPDKSISCYISKLVENYFNQDVNPLSCIFTIALDDIKEEVRLILEKTFADENKSFETWLKSLQKNAQAIIVLENIKQLKNLGTNDINLNQLNEKLKSGLNQTVTAISSDMQSYLTTNRELFKTMVVEEIKRTIIGCTEACPFCGAVCMVACADHSSKSDHYTTLHRPQGCKHWHNKDTKVLITRTCPVSVASHFLEFKHTKDGKEKQCLYKDYKKIYPEWKISADETGEETSFWNWFFATYAKEIARDNSAVATIPKSWKELDKETEIEKLRIKAKISWKTN